MPLLWLHNLDKQKTKHKVKIYSTESVPNLQRCLHETGSIVFWPSISADTWNSCSCQSVSWHVYSKQGSWTWKLFRLCFRSCIKVVTWITNWVTGGPWLAQVNFIHWICRQCKLSTSPTMHRKTHNYKLQNHTLIVQWKWVTTFILIYTVPD